MISLRLPTELVARLDSEAARRGSSRTALLEEGARHVLGELASSEPATKARAVPPPKRPPAAGSAWTCPQHGGFNRQPHCLVVGCTATPRAIK